MGSGSYAVCLMLFGIAAFHTLPVFGEDKVFDVIVVGAGMSGLSAANALQQLGLDVVVLEAKDRFGGRLWTETVTVNNTEPVTVKKAETVTVNQTKIPLDLGASWIHGIKYNPIYLLAKKNNLATIPTLYDASPNSHVYYDKTGDIMSAEQQSRLDTRFADFEKYLYKKYAYKPENSFKELVWDQFIEYPKNSEKSVKDALDEYLQNKNIESDRELFEHASTYYFLNTWAADIDQISPTTYNVEYAFGGKEVIFKEGYKEIFEPSLTEELDIRTNHVVNKIDYTSDIVLVSVEGEKEPLKADYVVVTVPLGVLKASVDKPFKKSRGAIEFVPPLPDEKVQSIKKLGMGVMDKAYLIFDEVFWRGDYDKEFISIMNPDGGGSCFMNLYPSLGDPILLAFNSGNYAKDLEKLDFERPELAKSNNGFQNLTNLQNLYNRPPSEDLNKADLQKYEDAVVRLAMDELEHVYGDELDVLEKENKNIRQVKGAAVTRWFSDPFARGSYSFPAVGSTPEDYRNIAKSVDGPPFSGTGLSPTGTQLFFVGNKLFFAGEATEPYHYGTVHGAYLSGIRAAEDVSFWYDWDTIHKDELPLFVIASLVIGGFWVPVLRWKIKRHIAMDVLGKSDEVAWRSTALIVVTVAFVIILYYWVESSVGAIPDIFDYLRGFDEECYTIDRLNDAIPYMRLDPEDEILYQLELQRCLDI